jgi:hypothetical protein
MKDFSDATFVPEIVDAMAEAREASVATLPHPVSSTKVTQLAESILRTAHAASTILPFCSGWRCWNCGSRRAIEPRVERLVTMWVLFGGMPMNDR